MPCLPQPSHFIQVALGGIRTRGLLHFNPMLYHSNTKHTLYEIMNNLMQTTQ
ncbi:hypothetical protein EXN66_Car000128 [Channa argus]|uniref:Uncharacterized protein n=1 Tax=Channa argus TaxID=215402 RepID=A0A6G1QWU5_CHAAH|nr:hypothetical protein EXN66_Car000128 [Channa argus]